MLEHSSLGLAYKCESLSLRKGEQNILALEGYLNSGVRTPLWCLAENLSIQQSRTKKTSDSVSPTITRLNITSKRSFPSQYRPPKWQYLFLKLACTLYDRQRKIKRAL
ncbi:hypothetical protein PoB_002131800 [Plakobranchus ocellatus]|uniref:Uncharacterized protein n=1 Tax=Plakobranchus ocellatus TaxID=259542 RepID=A0AAV3ZJY3_9GAST|nr:hypothetical protein PoB_002131800 [Plakobranchus ocellatus]